MKKLIKKYTGVLGLIFFLLMLPIHYAHSDNLDNLFGIKLYDDATNYVSSEYIENNKVKSIETISGYWDLNITSKASSPYFDEFFITIDSFNKIHGISGERTYISDDRCLTFLDTRKESISTKYNIKFYFEKEDYGEATVTRYTNWQESINISIICVHSYDPVQHYMSQDIISKTYYDAKYEYYNQD